MLDRRVRRVGLVTQRIQKENVQPLKLGQRAFRDIAVIGKASRRSEAKAVNLAVAMNQDNRLEPRAEKLERPVQFLHLNLRQSSEFVLRVENVAEHFTYKICGIRMRVQRQPPRFMQEA